MPQFVPVQNQLGQRLDSVIAKVLGVPRAQVQKAIESGSVTVGGQWIKRPAFKLQTLSEIVVTFPAKESLTLTPKNIPLTFLYEDEALLVVNKPAGMVVHPGAGRETETLVHALLAHCPDLPAGSEENKPGIVHRLDQGTSGAMVVAKTSAAMTHLLKQFKARQVQKIYQALVVGKMSGTGVINQPIGRHVKTRQKISSHTHKGREAITEWEAVESLGPFTLLHITLRTGRTHQIRVHLSERGHPIVGDPVYGKKNASSFSRPALHAWKLGFVHPVTEKQISFVAPLPEELLSLLAECRGLR